ncbi:hypothetical protein AAVH_13023 [Aphelenchoides avenae]|nr:hypothetical protein AAVH_13023 [Aphelenchus avenae]
MRNAREQAESLRDALRQADDENREMKRSINQLATNCERTSVANANENRQLQEKLASEQAKVQLMLDQAAISMKTFQDQVYVTVFGNHDGHTSMEQRLKDLQLRRHLKAEERKVINLRQETKALHEQRRCQICMDRASDTTFLCGQKNGPKDACGHVVCGECAENWRRQGKGCHLCRG